LSRKAGFGDALLPGRAAGWSGRAADPRGDAFGAGDVPFAGDAALLDAPGYDFGVGCRTLWPRGVTVCTDEELLLALASLGPAWLSALELLQLELLVESARAKGP